MAFSRRDRHERDHDPHQTQDHDDTPDAPDSASPAADSAAGSDPIADAQVAAIVGELATSSESENRHSRLLSRLAGLLNRGIRGSGRGIRWSTQRMVDEVLAMAPRIPVRDQATLRRQFPDLDDEELADALIEGATRASGAVGAAVGVWAVLPIAPLFAVEVAAETIAVVGIEIKLIAELHEVYGLRPAGSTIDRMTSYTAAWADRRGLAFGTSPGSLTVAIGPALRARLTRRLTRRAGRSTISLAPLLSGAAAGAWLNRRETHRLGTAVRNELRRAARGEPK